MEYLKKAETFVGRITAKGLKPNFAYQVKLKGVPKYRDSFERIGYLGRWRLPNRGPNCSDREYAAYENKSEARSYLFFDFFVTDEHGNATKNFMRTVRCTSCTAVPGKENPAPGIHCPYPARYAPETDYTPTRGLTLCAINSMRRPKTTRPQETGVRR